MARRSRTWFVVIAMTVLAIAGCGNGSDTATEPSSNTTESSSPGSTPSTQGNANPPVTQTVQVWFLDENNARTGEEPLYRPVVREVPPPALAAGALDALFAGPTAAEQADGLQVVLSGATGYSKLHIEDGIAHVTLAGDCSSGGSTMTIAGELFPTLKQFDSVDYVKIYAPDGTTEQPSGASDSIPDCLEP